MVYVSVNAPPLTVHDSGEPLHVSAPETQVCPPVHVVVPMQSPALLQCLEPSLAQVPVGQSLLMEQKVPLLPEQCLHWLAV